MSLIEGIPAVATGMSIGGLDMGIRHRYHGHMRNAADRFWGKVEVTPGCWLWMGARDTNGYGNFYLAGRTTKAHRFALETVCGPLGIGMQACHRCDNPPCVRPDHLFPGTALENQRDSVTKGRSLSPGPRRASRGEDRWSAKVNAVQVAELRALYATGEWRQRDLGIRFGIGQAQVSRIVNGRKWK